jgi:hypothetical protein
MEAAMFGFHENLAKWRTFKGTGISAAPLPWSQAIPVIVALSLLSWVVVAALARAVASIL